MKVTFGHSDFFVRNGYHRGDACDPLKGSVRNMENAKLKIERGEANLLYLSGRIDMLTSPLLRRELQDAEPGAEPLILDFSDVDYISSSGLRELLIAVKRLGREGLPLRNVSPEVEEIIKTAGFSELLDYTPAEAERDVRNMSFRDLLEYQARERGDSPIVKSCGVEYTWADIDRGASAVASELRDLGVRSRTHVALCGTNSVNWILTFYAIQKLGAIAVLLNPQLTAREIADLSRLGDITHFCFGDMPSVSDEGQFIRQITDPDSSLLRTVFDVRDSVDLMGRPLKAPAEAGRVMPDDVCVMIFTSGSTGTPKGVLLSAYNLLNSSYYCVDNLRMTEDDRLCAILPMFHVFGLTAVLLASALSGASLIFPQSVKPDELMRVIHEIGRAHV